MNSGLFFVLLSFFVACMIENTLGGRYRSSKSKSKSKSNTPSPSMQPTEEPVDCEEYIEIYKIECDDYDDDKLKDYIGKYEYIGNDNEYNYPIYQKCDSDSDSDSESGSGDSGDSDSQDDKNSKDDDSKASDDKDSNDTKDSKDDSKDDDDDDKDSKESKEEDDKDSKDSDDKDSKEDSDSKDDKDSDDDDKDGNDNDNNKKAEITLGYHYDKLELKINLPNIGIFYESNCDITDKDGYAKIIRSDDYYDPFDGEKEDEWQDKDGKIFVDIVAVIKDTCNEKAFDMY